ncbi:hypothetical protein BDW71DRAFT_209093 [Aspergillus fruticulosus]
MTAAMIEVDHWAAGKHNPKHGAGQLLMPRPKAWDFLRAEKLHNHAIHPLGPAFSDSYEQKMTVAPRQAQSSDPTNIYPSRLVNPDGITIRASAPYPEYIVISYTWGRWKQKSRENDTPIQGAHWKAPANTRFSRQELDLAVRNIAQGCHVWMDVLCIPQIDQDQGEKDEENSREIAKQGEIFRSASRAAVWLCSGGDNTLAEICSWVPEEHNLVEPNVLCTPSLTDLKKCTIDWTEATRRLHLIASLTEDVPWTTSLWTLQEAALRLDAIFHDKTGHPILHRETGNPLTIRHFVKTLKYIHVRLSHEAIPSNYEHLPSLVHYLEMLQATETEIDAWFRACDAVNHTNLHNLMSMNAGQLLMTSMHRTCQQPHDRIYGIMGAIGVSVEVDYSKPPSKVMNDFLLKLYNTVPAEMQAFHRVGVMRPRQSPTWVADENTLELGLVRQKPTYHAVERFTSITSSGALVASQTILLTNRGLDELSARFLSESVLPSLDDYAFSQLTNGAILCERSVLGNTYYTSELDVYIRAAVILRFTATVAQLGVISLGSISGFEEIGGWRFAYMLVGSSKSAIDTDKGIAKSRQFRRLGFLVFKDELTADQPEEGEFHIC